MTLINISHIPSSPGVYLFKDRKEKILYVGKAKNLAKRVSQYFTPGSVWKQDMVAKAHRVDFIEVRNESEALYLEDNLIKTNNPEYNRLLKGDNSYVYLKITKEDFPQIFITRMRKNDGSTYIGPKNNTGDLKKLMHYLRQIYKYRVMKSGEFRQGKLSSDFYFGLDKGRSVIAKYKDDINARNEALQKTGLILNKSYSEYKEEYKQIIKSISSFFEGNTKEVKNKILTDIKESIEQQHFEWCASLRDILQQIDTWTEKQHVVLDPNYTGMIIRITSLEQYWVIVMIKIFEGKMIDVIREKKSKDERSYNQMKASLEADFGAMEIKKSNTEIEHTLLSQSMKKIKKSDWDQIEILLQKFLESYIASTTFDREDNLTQDLLSNLQRRYYLTTFPYQIECIDISHLSGSYISGGLSCMRDGLLYKPGYRHYKIKTLEDNKGNYSNDFLSLQEIIVRRFGLKSKKNNLLSSSGAERSGYVLRSKVVEVSSVGDSSISSEGRTVEFPNLFILDGGKGQLNTVLELCQIFPSLQDIMKTTTFISLGKGKARKESSKSRGENEKIYYLTSSYTIQEAELRYDQADLLLTKIRDEAHRFANKYRTTRMSKDWK